MLSNYGERLRRRCRGTSLLAQRGMVAAQIGTIKHMQVTRVMDKSLTEVAMMDESVQMSLVHFIVTRRPNRNGWDKEVCCIEKGVEVFTIGVLHL